MFGASELGLVEYKQSAGKVAGFTSASDVRLVPKKVFFTSGVGRHADALVSFELALRDAGIEKFNLVTVSSIFPPGCEIVTKEEGLKDLFPGQIVFCVMSRMTSCEAGKKIFASVGVAIPDNTNLNGYLTEYHGYCNGKEGRHAEEMAAYMLKTAFDIEPARTMNFTASAEVGENEFTTVVSAAVFVI